MLTTALGLLVAIPLIIVGALMMLPLLIFLVTRATNRG